jgi:hypothetical protein
LAVIRQKCLSGPVTAFRKSLCTYSAVAASYAEGIVVRNQPIGQIAMDKMLKKNPSICGAAPAEVLRQNLHASARTCFEFFRKSNLS